MSSLSVAYETGPEQPSPIIAWDELPTIPLSGNVLPLFTLRQLPRSLTLVAPPETNAESAAATDAEQLTLFQQGFDYFEPTSPIARLSPRQREVARLAVSNAAYKEIADTLSITTPTVRTHLHYIYVKLGINRSGPVGPNVKTELATHLGLEEDSIDASQYELEKLSPAESRIFDLMSLRLATPVIQKITGLSMSTIRSHQAAIYKNLGVSGRAQLVRLAIEANKHRVGEAITTTWPLVQDILDQLETAHKEGHINLNRPEAVKKIKNRHLLDLLVTHGYITTEMATAGTVGLSGLVAALLINRAPTQELVLGQTTSQAMRGLIEQEVEQFLTAQAGKSRPQAQLAA